MYANKQTIKAIIEIKANLFTFFKEELLIQFLFNHSIISVKTPNASITPPNNALEELGGTPILLVKIAMPGTTANTPDATARKFETFFTVFKNLSKQFVLFQHHMA